MSYNPFVSLKWMTDGRTVDGLATRGAAELVCAKRRCGSLHQRQCVFHVPTTDKRGTLEPGRLADLRCLTGITYGSAGGDRAR